MSKEVIGRRAFLQDYLVPGTVTALLLPVLSGCRTQGTSSLVEVPSQTKELEDKAQMGDVVVVGKEAFLLRNDSPYPIPDLETYRHHTKFDKYGRRIFNSSTIPLAVDKRRLRAVPQGEWVRDPYTDNRKKNKPLGGEMNVFFTGFMTDGGVSYDHIRHEASTFLFVRGALSKHGWDNEDSFFFTWGEKGKSSYPPENTARPLAENTNHALEFFQSLKELFPLVQFNLIGHSLGAVMALEVARKHADAINNLICIDGPLRGLEPTWKRRGEVAVLRQFLKEAFDIEERVIDDLFNRWNKESQRQLDEFGLLFTSPPQKRGLINIINENDQIVPVESSIIKGARVYRIAKEDRVIDYLGYPEEHGRNLRNKEAIEEYIVAMIGEDLSDVA